MERIILKTDYFRNSGYRLLPITNEIASKILAGEFKTIAEVNRASHISEEKQNIEVLYREIDHPITKDEIAIIETFFMDIKE
jgi:hypothetical protein